MKFLLIFIFSFKLFGMEISPKKHFKFTNSETLKQYTFLEQEFASVLVNNEEFNYSQTNLIYRYSFNNHYSYSFYYGKSFLSNSDSHFSNVVGLNFIYSTEFLGKRIKHIHLLKNKYVIKNNKFKKLNKTKYYKKEIKKNAYILRLGYSNDTYVQVFDIGTNKDSVHLSLGYEFFITSNIKGNIGYKYSYNNLYNMNKLTFSLGF